jgi:hypothetical protein
LFGARLTVDQGGGYDRATWSGTDSSLSYIYEAGGALVAVVEQTPGHIACVAGPASGAPTFTPGTSEIVDCSSDASTVQPEPDASVAPRPGEGGAPWWFGDAGDACLQVEWKHSRVL